MDSATGWGSCAVGAGGAGGAGWASAAGKCRAGLSDGGGPEGCRAGAPLGDRRRQPPCRKRRDGWVVGPAPGAVEFMFHHDLTSPSSSGRSKPFVYWQPGHVAYHYSTTPHPPAGLSGPAATAPAGAVARRAATGRAAGGAGAPRGGRPPRRSPRPSRGRGRLRTTAESRPPPAGPAAVAPPAIRAAPGSPPDARAH